MRLRNRPEAKGIIAESPFVIHEIPAEDGSVSSFFPDRAPLDIEIGTGKGKFLLEMAQRHPERNYIGVERYESVLFRGCERLDAMENPPGNLKFLCMDARELTDVLWPDTVERIYLNFSDPWPKARHERRRLTSGDFRAIYKKILKTGGQVEFKTDNRSFFDYSVEEFRADPDFSLTQVCYDLHRDPELAADNIMTEYERKFSALGNRICKLTAVLNGEDTSGGSGPA